MRYLRFRTGFILMLLLAAASLTAGAEEDILSAESKAQRAHELSQSDVMYQQEDFRALYYQNLQIIALLKEIRDEMRAVNMRTAKEEKK